MKKELQMMFFTKDFAKEFFIKTHIKTFIIFISLFLFVSCGTQDLQVQDLQVNNTLKTQPLLANSPTRPQKLADTPKDKPISVLLKNGVIACYAPTFQRGEGVISLQPCSKAPKARYDVFGRVAWLIGVEWLCMSEPENLSTSSTNLVLRPCVINETKQSWDFKNNAFVSVKSKLQVQDLNGVLVLSPDKKANNHALSGMQEWISTIATPVNLNINTFLAWDFATGQGTFETYYLRNDESLKNTITTLIYNPISKQIMQYNASNGNHICLTSNQSKNQDWNWVFWTKCDLIEKRGVISTQSWDLNLFGTNNKSFLLDYAGNYLRLTQYGLHWGVPYTAKPDYIHQDTANAPISLFRFSNDMQDLLRFSNANLGDLLPFCPANSSNAPLLASQALYLPASFTLTEEWKKRLWEIAVTTNGVAERIGDCGVCMLQSFQMIAELNEYSTPLTSGGYFFNTQAGANPFVSFRSRYPLLSAQLEQYSTLNIPRELSQQEFFAATAQMYRSMALTMYPTRTYRSEDFATNEEQIRTMLSHFLAAPAGSMWMLNIYSRDRSGRQNGHNMPVIRLQDYLLFIPTNTLNASYQAYTNALQRFSARSVDEAMAIISNNYTQNVYLLFSLSVEEPYSNPLNATVSNNNCTGEGDNRHGSRSLLSPELINQCTGGRCLIQ